MRINIVFTIIIFFTISAINAQSNFMLQRMADDDQNSRIGGITDWDLLRKQDSIRRIKVLEMMRDNKLNTAKDYYNAGIIFHHGNDTISSEMVVTCFKRAFYKDSTLNRWWYAAAVDRNLMRKGKPQIYGTQHITVKDTSGKAVTRLYDLDTTKITDEERSLHFVPSLAELKKELK
ncbi:hypothetical protein HX109_05125 [Galbibacter sp. BG1]|uniref:DUF6624 domain-containing protein n=1 Tax=Galbibacter sp. BG1 TaxID=1170699 RepID=UPI0015C06FC9|nr:DUF6624 domain-containing protein [Galbibacter sp. BG1]QLE00976.1 hypothetical protein HX109_05125 [Galbibacter sp. BG1]